MIMLSILHPSLVVFISYLPTSTIPLGTSDSVAQLLALILSLVGISITMRMVNYAVQLAIKMKTGLFPK